MPDIFGNEARMKKISVSLREQDIQRLHDLSRRTGRSQAEVIRAAIAAYEPAPRDRSFAIIADDEQGAGDSIADHDEAELLNGFGE